ncbi:copper oxidase [Massilia luteola]|uniref:multicopper oxidase family protein n=1 Tax=Massilia luteola TaxID=3081751 RepID=UPI002ACC1C6B|nr:copper oxidase [Massilia sp. Gc5]
MTSRRNFITGAAGAMVGASLVSKAGAAAIPEAPVQASAATQPPQHPTSGRPYNPVVTLNGWSLPWRMKDGVKEFHLVAEPVVREIAPGMKANLWGYNGQSPGPTIEVVEGDKVRIFVTNKLPEATTIHWHGQILPNGMDGVAGLVQPAIAPGKTFVYEFVARHAGTFMYHPHSDEMTQMAMGMMGFWVTHPKDPRRQAVDRDFVFLLNAYDIAPGNYTPNVNTMLDFNLWTINSRAFPGTDPMVVRKDDKVRIRMGNLTMTNHPFHIHGHRFEVTGTDGGWIAPAARWPEVTVDIGVGQMRAIEFVADNPGDWAFHCHKSHHTMNAMSHDAPTLIGVDQAGVAQTINDLVPGYMVMGDKGGSMGGMQMPLPENTLPMMAGRGPFGGIEMGGMFTVIKVREGLARGDYRDPGWYRHPAGTVAREWTGAVPEAVNAPAAPAQGELIGTARRRQGGGGHEGH